MEVVITIHQYQQQMKAIGYAKKTIALYAYGLDRFKDWLGRQGIEDLRQVTAAVIEAYRKELMGGPQAAETKAIMIRAVKRLFEYLTGTQQLLLNPAEAVVATCRQNRKVGTVLTPKEIKKMLDQPNLSLRLGIRDRAVMQVLYSSGIRKEELVNLSIYDADLKDGVLFVRKAKGRRQRVVPLGKVAALGLKEYLQHIRPHYARKNPKCRRLFLTYTGASISKSAVSNLIARYRKQAGIKKPVSAHTFRRSCATHLVQQGADIRYVQKLLGHQRLKTTQLYTKIMPLDVKKIHEKTHPGVAQSA